MIDKQLNEKTKILLKCLTYSSISFMRSIAEFQRAMSRAVSVDSKFMGEINRINDRFDRLREEGIIYRYRVTKKSKYRRWGFKRYNETDKNESEQGEIR